MSQAKRTVNESFQNSKHIDAEKNRKTTTTIRPFATVSSFKEPLVDTNPILIIISKLTPQFHLLKERDVNPI
jgi:hypothetical protein